MTRSDPGPITVRLVQSYSTLEAMSLLLPCCDPEPRRLGSVPPAGRSGQPAATSSATTSCRQTGCSAVPVDCSSVLTIAPLFLA